MPMHNQIPTGDTREDVYIRRAVIVERLAPLIGTSVPCGAFGNKKVEFVFASIDETATRASRYYESTLAALRVVEALKKATLVKIDLPKSNKQRKMNFTKIYELATTLKGLGNIKIIVGEKKNTRIIHYCITKKEQ